MIKTACILLAGSLALASTVSAHAADAPATATAPAAAPRFTTAETSLGDLLDDAGAKAVLEKHIPEMVNSGNLEPARGMTLKALQAYAGAILTDDKLAAIDADLAKIPAK